jgi:hypothetical protein
MRRTAARRAFRIHQFESPLYVGLFSLQRGSHTGLQLRERERLQQLIIKADIESAHPILNRVFGCENQHRRLEPCFRSAVRISNPIISW